MHGTLKISASLNFVVLPQYFIDQFVNASTHAWAVFQQYTTCIDRICEGDIIIMAPPMCVCSISQIDNEIHLTPATPLYVHLCAISFVSYYVYVLLPYVCAQKTLQSVLDMHHS